VPTPSPLPDLTIELSARTAGEQLPFLRKFLRDAVPIAAPRLRNLSVLLAGDAIMARLHEAHLDLPGPTDVLTFELEHDVRGRCTEGEVVIGVPHARREAKRRGLALRKELALYALHGVLHLAGHDDTTARGYRAMHAAEDRLLVRLGLGAVFAADRS
jgi:probable rRNA maturation factor